MKAVLSVALALSCCAQLALGMARQRIAFRLPPAGQPPLNSSTARHSTFQQLIDHDNPSLGTFSQFYYWDDYYYKGPGSPVVLFTPGEVDALNYYTYLTKNRTTGVIAESLGAAVIVLEHRYWGKSSPYKTLSTENMQFLTLKNSIADLNNFALKAKLPFDKGGASNADKAPWVLAGGSYSGALTAWTESVSNPRVIWAYYASSAVVETIGDYWRYFQPQQENMPKNCTTDIARVVEHLDNLYETGTLKQQADAKALFGLEDLPYFDDFMEVLVNGPYLWQGNQFYQNAGFFDFCDAVEGVNNKSTVIPGASGVGLPAALKNYGGWVKKTLLPGYCASFGYYSSNHSVECFNSHNKNSPMYTDMTLKNTYDRQWDWMLCNEPFGWWQNGNANPKAQTIVSRLIDNRYWTRQCNQWFPAQNGIAPGVRLGKKYSEVNAYTGGWGQRNSTRLLFVNGGNDPWRESTVSAHSRPGGPLQSTPQQPVFVVPGGYHTSDLVTANKVNEDCAAIQDAVVRQIKAWVKEFPSQKA